MRLVVAEPNAKGQDARLRQPDARWKALEAYHQPEGKTSEAELHGSSAPVGSSSAIRLLARPMGAVGD